MKGDFSLITNTLSVGDTPKHQMDVIKGQLASAVRFLAKAIMVGDVEANSLISELGDTDEIKGLCGIHLFLNPHDGMTFYESPCTLPPPQDR